MTARLTPDWQPETVDQRIERVIASVPELCPNCGGTGSIEIVGKDVIEHFICPVCIGYGESYDPEDE